MLHYTQTQAHTQSSQFNVVSKKKLRKHAIVFSALLIVNIDIHKICL